MNGPATLTSPLLERVRSSTTAVETDGATLLITGTVDPRQTSHVAVSDPQQRRFEYACSLVAWLNEPAVTTIVFCENSSTDWDFSALHAFAGAQGKTVEVLAFEGDASGAARFGKGWGEGEIMRHALAHSAHLGGAFYKCSGRTGVQNFADIEGLHAPDRAVFQPSPWYTTVRNLPFPLGLVRALRWKLVAQRMGARSFHPNDLVSTLFYKCDRRFWRQHLSAASRSVHDSWGYYLEHAFWNALQQATASSANWVPFEVAPYFTGRSGSTGKLREGGDFSPEVQHLARTLL